MSDCTARSSAGIPCERDDGHKGKHGFDSAYGEWVEFTKGFVPEAVLSRLQAENTRLREALRDMLPVLRMFHQSVAVKAVEAALAPQAEPSGGGPAR